MINYFKWVKKPLPGKGMKKKLAAQDLPKSARGLDSRVKGLYMLACEHMSPEQYLAARDWYAIEHKAIQALADKHGVSLARVCAIVSALSPGNKWAQNLRDADSVLSAAHPDNIRVCTYGPNKAKAYAVKWAPEDDIFSLFSDETGRKTKSFAENLVNPSKNDVVTVDSWMYRAIGLLPVNTAASGTDACYTRIEESIKRVAARFGLKGHELQAIIWIFIRETADMIKKGKI